MITVKHGEFKFKASDVLYFDIKLKSGEVVSIVPGYWKGDIIDGLA